MHHVVIYSGGMDSYTLLHWVLKTKLDIANGDTLQALSFNYGQRHSKELLCAVEECRVLGIRHRLVDLTSLTPLLQGSALTSDIDVPEGHYEAESMKLTVVPGRNTIMLSIAMAYAESGCLLNPGTRGKVYFGAHAGDHHIYPDCRAAFADAFEEMADYATEGKVGISAPFLNRTKGEILAIGHELNLDYKNTWTCYKGGEEACGVCGSCSERLEAFAENGLIDPLPYEKRRDGTLSEK